MKSMFKLFVALLAMAMQHFIIRPVKAVGAGLSAFSNVMGAAPGVLANIWTSNQNADAPTSSGTVSAAISTATARLDAELGILTVTGCNAAAGVSQTVTLLNAKVVSTSMVVASINRFAGTFATNGEPNLVSADTTTAGRIVFRILNTDAADAIAGNITISFVVHQIVR